MTLQQMSAVAQPPGKQQPEVGCYCWLGKAWGAGVEKQPSNTS